VQGRRDHPGLLDGELDVALLGGRGGDADGRLALAVHGQLGELPGDVLESLLVLLVHEGQAEGLDVLRVHLRDDLDDLHGHGHVRVLGGDLR